MNDWTLLAGGGFLLYLGAEWFVGGASALALALRVPQMAVRSLHTATPERSALLARPRELDARLARNAQDKRRS